MILSCRVVKLLDTDEYRQAMISSLPDHSYRVDVVVTQVYKGKVMRNDTLRIAPLDPSNCDFYFQMGREYVLFGDIKAFTFEVRTCSYSEEMEHADNVLTALREAHLDPK